ncbi:MAG: cytochrome c-type biogenesis protein CcmH [Thioalkalivibrio sp.]|nr:cytochrome c-type biogenesis protein CcmH [Thioalkalivibrio sp.]
MKPLFRLFVLAFCLVPGWGAASLPASPTADDPALEARLNHLAEDLRCVVCQNESLAESRASLALDLREEIREMMREGVGDDAVVESLVARYGDFVLYRPPVKPLTYVLWGGPVAFLLLGSALALATLHRRRTMQPQADVSSEALRDAAQLLRSDDSKHPGSPIASATASRPSYEEER